MDKPINTMPPEWGRREGIRKSMRPAVTTVERHAHLAAAAYLMRRAGDTAVVVTTDDENREPLAVITTTDIAQAVADGKDVNDVRIEELVGPKPVTAQPTMTVNEATAVMLAEGIRHLPVVEDGRLVGIFDITDACRELFDMDTTTRRSTAPS